MLPSVEAQKAEEQFEVQVMSPSEGKSKRVAAFTAAESGPFDGGSEEGDGVGNLDTRVQVLVAYFGFIIFLIFVGVNPSSEMRSKMKLYLRRDAPIACTFEAWIGLQKRCMPFKGLDGLGCSKLGQMLLRPISISKF